MKVFSQWHMATYHGRSVDYFLNKECFKKNNRTTEKILIMGEIETVVDSQIEIVWTFCSHHSRSWVFTHVIYVYIWD